MTIEEIMQEISKTKTRIPIFDCLMTDEEWEEAAVRDAVHAFTIINGFEPESLEDAETWLKFFLASLEEKRGAE